MDERQAQHGRVRSSARSRRNFASLALLGMTAAQRQTLDGSPRAPLTLPDK